MDNPYKCTRSGCDRGFATDEERKRHATEPHQPCPHGCNRSFTTHGLASHVKSCELNPERTRGRIPCIHQGCTARFADQAAFSAHAAESHAACVCGSEFTTTSLRKHQVRCGVYLAAQAEARESVSCHGCHEAICEGEHFLVLQIDFRTRMASSFRMVRDVAPTTIEDITLHGPYCFMQWALNNELITNVFGQSWGDGDSLVPATGDQWRRSLGIAARASQ